MPVSPSNRSTDSPLIPVLQQTLAAYDDVIAAYLFGSYARGTAGALADVDVAVLVAADLDDQRRFALQLDLMSALQRALSRDDVDVVVLNAAPLALSYRVLRDGILLTCRDQQTRIDFTARTVSQYLDFKPFIERHEQQILARARRGALLDGYNPHRGALERYRRLRKRLEGTTAVKH